MCGRYYIDEEMKKDIERIVGETEITWKRAGDIHPTEAAPIICGRGRSLCVTEMKWGLAGRDQRPLINARAETAMEKPSFSESVLHRRCIIPARCFYEWNQDRQKVTFRSRADKTIYMAGFYRIYEDGPHFIILTTAANASMRPVHDRMPLILEEQELVPWICEDLQVNLFLKKNPPGLERSQDFEQMSLF